MRARVLQQVFAVGFAGIFGVTVIPGSTSGWAAAPKPEGTALAEPMGGQEVMSKEEAEAWLASMDESSPMGDSVVPKFECMNKPYECPYHAQCSFGGVTTRCNVTQCGEGKCGMCPDAVSKLLIKDWCAYGCMRGTEMVGGAFILKTRFGGDNGPWCIGKDGNVSYEGPGH